MLVITRRPGESVLIGENIEIMIIDADGIDGETRCAISVCDEHGSEVPLQHWRERNGTTLVRER